jgi:benzoylformate decarboxylase
MDPDACFVSDDDSIRGCLKLMTFGAQGRQYFSMMGTALGWTVPAALGVKLGQPDRQVVAVVGDGSCLFGGLEPLWSYSRYRAPVTVIVANNRSYDGERRRAWGRHGRQFETGKDMACYNGDPNVDFVKGAAAFGVKGEQVTDPAALRPALERSRRAVADGEPYLIDVLIEREGLGAASQWHPEFSIANLRKKKV